MKNIKIKLPYVSYEMEIYIQDIEYHHDPRVRENVRNALGPARYHAWHTLHLQGNNQPLKVRNRVHIRSLLKDRMVVSQIVGILLIVIPVIVVIGLIASFAFIGSVEVFKFIMNLFN